VSEALEPDAEKGPVRRILEQQLDENNYKIFRELNQNGRMSDTDLAKRVGLSRTAVRRRREALQEEGIIDILAVIVLQEADLAYADVRVRLSQHAKMAEREAFIERLIDEELIYSIDSCIGEHDLFVRVWNATLADIKSYVWTLFEDEDVVDSYTLDPVVKTWKAWDKTLDRPSDGE